MSTASQPSPKRRGPSRWFKVTVITVLVLANLVAFGAWWALRQADNLLKDATSDEEVSDLLDAPTGSDLTFLVVGSDTRDGLDDLSDFGNFGGARADVIMLVRVSGSSSNIQMLSIPRDLWVQIPGHQDNRINAAYALGGSSKLVETLRHNLNVEINHYVEISFAGFMSLVDELGGITLDFPYPARDLKSHLNVGAGRQVVDGRTALAYSRSRAYQENQGGRWVSVDASDVGRTKRQQTVMKAIVAALKSPSSIADAGAITSSIGRHMTIDSRLARSSIGSLAWDMRGVLTGATEGATLPISGRNIDGRSVVVPNEPEFSAMLANFRAGREMTVAGLQPNLSTGG